MRIPESKVAEIYQAADILEVINDYVTLKKRGTNWIGLSPFKTEKTPSFTVNPAKGIFKDFSSGKGGNLISFLMEVEGYTYVEALQHLARKYGIEIEVQDDPEFKDQESRKQSLFVLNEFATKYFSKQLWENEEGKQLGLGYFLERGLSEEIIRQFQLGYNPEQRDSFTQQALEHQYSPEHLLQTGLSIQPEGSPRLMDRFRGRVIFPIHQPNGKISGFGGRILSSVSNIAKYVNSPESEIYHKSEVLYGLYFAREEIRQQSQVILVEGYLDVISLHQRGIKNVVSVSGTALSEYQVKTLARLAKKVVLLNDADKAGINASLRAIDILLEKELDVKIVVLPEGEDPDSYVRNSGPDGLREFIAAHSMDFVEFRKYSMPGNIQEPGTLAALADQIAGSIARISDPLLSQAWIQEAARKLHFPEQTLISAVNRHLIEAGKQAAKAALKLPESTEASPVSPIPAYSYNPFDSSAQEKELIRLLLNHGDKIMPVSDAINAELSKVTLSQYLFVELNDFVFSNDFYEKIKKILFDRIHHNLPLDLDLLLNHTDAEISMTVAELLVIREELSPQWSKISYDVPTLDYKLVKSAESALHRYICYHLDRLLTEVEQKLKTAVEENAEEEKVNEILRQYYRLKQLDREHNLKPGTVIKRL
ncbi:MAG: DNA primase [Sphingobacteriia bacterium]|nr:DNA primase [Sphingobacteriia bacterium]